MTDLEPRADCPLCEAARITPWFHEDDVCWIAECEICATPMVVWRHHGVKPPEVDREHMLGRLADVAGTELGPHWVDPTMRNIPDHFHAHARPAGGFFGPKKTGHPPERHEAPLASSPEVQRKDPQDEPK